jgi:hypothetical protein
MTKPTCPHCGHELTPKDAASVLGSIGGMSTSEAKTKAARLNAKKGGRKPCNCGKPHGRHTDTCHYIKAPRN